MHSKEVTSNFSCECRNERLQCYDQQQQQQQQQQQVFNQPVRNDLKICDNTGKIAMVKEVIFQMIEIS